MNKKLLAIIGGAVALVAIVVACIFIFTGGEDAYRSIKVFEIDGSCKVERAGDTLDAFKNMALSSGDVLTVGDGSYTRLKLDDDKYVYLEANTKIKLTATGTANDSKTTVFVERGSMLTEVKKKLSATSSYDIVTPNTTMSIRGTKTLTEVIEDVVTGNVQTSNAVLEGQVKIKAVKVKADGTVVSVERDLGAGEGNAFKSAKEELVSQEEMQAIAETGASVSGIKVEIVSEEEAGVVFDVATFDATFLESVKSILIADAEAASGEGISDEELDVINAQIDEAIKSLDVIREESQKAIDAAATTGNNTPMPVQEPVPETTSDTTPEPVSGPVSDLPSMTDDNDQDEGTTVIDGDTNLIDIGDDNDDEDDGTGNDAGTGDEHDDTDDEAGTDDNDDDENVDDGSDEENDEEDAGNEDADEEENAGDDEDEGDEEDADKEDEDEDKEDEEDEESEAERLAREEAERLEREAQEAAEREAAEQATREEEARLAREEAERLEREAQEAAEREAAEQAAREEEARLAREQAERDAQQSQSSSSSSSTTTTERQVSYNDYTTNVSFRYGSGTTVSSIPVKVEFYTETDNGNDTITQTYSMSSLPASDFVVGAPLPGFDHNYFTKVVPADESVVETNPGARFVESYYSFTGWYTSESDAASNDLSNRYTTYSSELQGKQLYPGITRSAVVFLHNSNYDMGYVSFPSADSSPDIIRWEPTEEGVVAIVKAGSTINLPVAETPAASETIDHAFVCLKQANASFFCYHEHNCYVERGDDVYMDSTHLDIFDLSIKTDKPSTDSAGNAIYYASEHPQYHVSEDASYIYLEMYYTATVEVRVADYSGEGKGLLTVKMTSTGASSFDYQRLSSVYSGNVSAMGTSTPTIDIPGLRDGSYKWTLTKQSEAKQAGAVTLDVYTFKTVFTGTYDKDLNIPSFSLMNTSDTSGYSRDLLCSYRLKNTAPVVTFRSDQGITLGSFPANPEGVTTDFTHVTNLDGKYIFTVQPVDWVYIDFNVNDLPSGTDYYFHVGANNPYMIPKQDSDDSGEFVSKFAMNPVDLFSVNSVTQSPSAPFDFTAQHGSDNAPQWFVYAPDDIIYPWISVGSLRSGADNVTSAQNICNSCISASDRAFYSYVGARGYKLAGFTIIHRKASSGGTQGDLVRTDFELHGSKSEIDPQTLAPTVIERYLAYPCIKIGTTDTSIANEVSLDFIIQEGTPSQALSEPIRLKPVFVPASPITASLSYNEATSVSAKESVLQNYTLTLSGVDETYLRNRLSNGHTLSLKTLSLDLFAPEAFIGFKIVDLSSFICYESSNGKYVTMKLPNWMVDDDSCWTSGNGGTLSITLDKLSALYTFDNSSRETLGREKKAFVRGLVQSGNHSSTFATYNPAEPVVVPSVGGAYKYSAFVTDSPDYGIRYYRVFESDDSFTSTSSSTLLENIKTMLADMISVPENATAPYYGGEITPFSTYSDQSGITYYLGGPGGTISSGDDYMRKIIRYRTDEDIPLMSTYAAGEIDDLLQAPEGYAGLWTFTPFSYILVNNWDGNGEGDQKTPVFAYDVNSSSYGVPISRWYDNMGNHYFHLSTNQPSECFICTDSNNITCTLYNGFDETLTRPDEDNAEIQVPVYPHRANVTFLTGATSFGGGV